ncbi:DUF1003 domain-containing protein [Serinibacter salmoneus]|uniref:Putative membrane protein n=1 Tax=Serinibacter salmoneus TaxID=556530 RepID=A0A2A9CXF3_9MICO|nr:DUF1003 domain-containing protein [Serinibacter salmoneus]PFG19117.1 putative membrane protein [Serinibacter salmoneus]
MAEQRTRLDTPLHKSRNPFVNRRRAVGGDDGAGQVAESIARFLGTPSFIIWLTVFCLVWIGWNTLAAEEMRFDDAALGFTALTLMLSLQASYAAPLILLAQNRQTDRDRVAAEQDRQRTERNLADTEFLAREMASLRVALQDVATRDYVRGELRELLEDIGEQTRKEVRKEVRREVRNEIRTEIRGELRSEVLTEVRSEVREEIRAELAAERKRRKRKERQARREFQAYLEEQESDSPEEE